MLETTNSHLDSAELARPGKELGTEQPPPPPPQGGDQIDRVPAGQSGVTRHRRMEERLIKINQLQSALHHPGTLQEKLGRITDGIVDIFAADFARIWLIRPGDLCAAGCPHAKATEGPHVCRDRDRCLHLLASSGRYPHLDGASHRRVPFGCYKIGRVASGEMPSFLTNDVTHDPRVHDHEWAVSLGLVSFAGYQLRVPNGEIIGVLALFSRHSILPEEDTLLRGISNLILPVVQSAQIEGELRESEGKFRLMTATARDAIVMLDHHGKVFFWNRAAEEMLGYSEAEMKNQEMHPLLAPERYQNAYRKGLGHFHETGEGPALGQTLELMARRKDGVEVPIELSVSGVRLEGRWHALGIIRDITARKRAEAELNYERNLLRSLMDHSDDCIYFKDLQSRFLRCSLAQVRHFRAGCLAEVIGKTDRDFFSGEHVDAALQDEQNIIRTGAPLIGKVEKETWPDGRITWALTSKMPLRNEAGEMIGTFGLSKDITAIKEAEKKMEVLHRQLVEASRETGMAEVATSVLHNVGNVLNSVNVSFLLISETVVKSKASSLLKVVALLRQHGDDLPGFFANDAKGRQLPDYLASLAARLGEEHEEIQRELGTLAGSLQHIKEVIAMQQRSAKLLGLVETLPVAGLVEDALQLNLGALERHGITLVREFASVPPVPVEKHKVLQILVNLIRNAKYACADSGRPDKRIILRIAAAEKCVKISVEDNGVGIVPENLTRIFHHGFTTRLEGHGFGLHSGALAARELGGSLEAFSRGPGQGATFTLELPLKAARTSL